MIDILCHIILHKHKLDDDVIDESIDDARPPRCTKSSNGICCDYDWMMYIYFSHIYNEKSIREELSYI